MSNLRRRRDRVAEIEPEVAALYAERLEEIARRARELAELEEARAAAFEVLATTLRWRAGRRDR